MSKDMPVDAYPADTGNPEADKIIDRLASSDPDFDDCFDAIDLIRRLIATHPAGTAGEHALLTRWDARALDALPTDAMLINRHIRELREVLATAAFAAASAQQELSQKCLPDGIRYMLPPLNLTGHQVLHLAEMAQAADSLNAIWQIKELPAGRDADGAKTLKGIGAKTDGQPGWAMLNVAPTPKYEPAAAVTTQESEK